MYISKFNAFNYRSLKQISLKFNKGKNVIVGKNNSGKSNIIKGIEILIGEKFPTYINFTDNDFYTHEILNEDTGEIIEKVENNIYLDIELSDRDINEELIRTIKKKTAFSKINSISSIYTKLENDTLIVNFDFFQSLDEIEHRDEIENNGSYKKTDWKTPDTLISFLKSAKIIKIFFCKSRIEEEKSGYGIFVVDYNNDYWVSHFVPKKLRDSLITTTVISALRSQKEDLRLVHFTWFGKLIKGLWERNKNNINSLHEKTYEALIVEKSSEIKNFVDDVFRKDTEEIRKLLSGAIAHHSISFRFLNDQINNLYKNVNLFVNDGIDRPLNEKGTGIQSAIIISLFSMYCNEFHNNSSLLITEEPELYLHPQARRIISAELEKFLNGSSIQQRQLIISTHSTEYLKNIHPKNIIRVYKDVQNNCSIVKQLNEDVSKDITIELQRFLWSNNTELFFADKAILVEGGEVYLLPSLVDKIKCTKQLLDYENISVSRVNGKGSFLTYMRMLNCFNIPYIVLGDLDCFKDVVSKFVLHFEINTISDNVSKIKKAISEQSVNYEVITERCKNVDKNLDAQQLQHLFELFISKQIDIDNEDLHATIEYMQSRYTKGDKYQAIIDSIGEEEFTKTQEILRQNNIFIWSKGELENYYSSQARSLKGNTKDIKALLLSYSLEEKSLEDLFLHIDEIICLINLILEKDASFKTFKE